MYTALSATSETLLDLVRRGLAQEIQFFADATMEATLNKPQEMTENGHEGVSVWLYRVVRDEHRLNAPPARPDRFESERVPLPVRLHYLITPIVNRDTPGSVLTEQTILGRVLQVLHDHPIVRGADLRGDFEGTDTEVAVRLESLGLDEIARVWEALDRSYQLSVSYEVTVVYVRSQREPERAAPVESVEPEWGVITSVEPA